MFHSGVIHRFVTPLKKIWVTGKKEPISFFEEHEFQDWLSKNPNAKYKQKYYKGLATSQVSEFKEYLDNINDHLIQIKIETKEDEEIIELVFGKAAGSADRRKEWLALTEKEEDDVEE